MAYHNTNPDALPAHAEPEQAAQLMSNNSNYHPTMSQSPRPSQQGGYPQQRPPQGYNQHPQQHYSPQQQHGFQQQYGGQQGYGQQQQYGGQQGYGGQQQQYTQGPPPQGPHGRPPVQNRPPPTPAPQQGTNPTLYPLFTAVDKDGSGQLSERELRAALVNGDWTSFDPHTVKMMIRMFDTDRSGTIGFQEFCGLWGFLADWRKLFDRFDTDRSGNISYDEFTNALEAFGYRLSPQFVNTLFRSYDRRGQDTAPYPEGGTSSPLVPHPPILSIPTLILTLTYSLQAEGQNAISFDLFVQSCISLKRMTEVFKKYDHNRVGYITLSFEEFLTEILRQR
ncbi:Similar to Programmed cell death protein 6; acc. no. P12815 [Pyronema omphalodes CBS 100304]|uniref:Similar to Programmed cell death protein 6 acc. no. P12815 n=1 Tax=Pyronema omphalodes (strain CBS 100304) TaxID=1076935 RepID=U4LN55_PYROM|nr:Similar to Programmed cell death protein 6; acc. no. P12815 [Pyronema omphalodes CBS 100304]